MKNNGSLFIKISIVLSGILLLFSVIIFPVGCSILGIDFDSVEKIWIVTLLITVMSTMIMVYLLFRFGIEKKGIKANGCSIIFKEYDSFIKSHEKSLIEHNYQKSNMISISKASIIIYCKPISAGVLHAFVIIKSIELDGFILQEANDAITNHFSQMFKPKNIMAINLISLFCVERITPTFRELVDNQPIQGWKNGRFNAGISFGGKKLYIAQQKGGFGFLNYKKLKKEFHNVFNYAQELSCK